jgi:hypothetical protein
VVVEAREGVGVGAGAGAVAEGDAGTIDGGEATRAAGEPKVAAAAMVVAGPSPT